MTLHVDDASRLTGVRLTNWFADDWGRSAWMASWWPRARYLGREGLPPYDCEQGKTFYAYPNLDLRPFADRRRSRYRSAGRGRRAVKPTR
jgi:hypothetical protein